MLLSHGMGDGGVLCKISDFGSSIRLPNDQNLTETIGTLGYTAPEVYNTDVGYSYPADVFSVGVIMWELFCRPKRNNPMSSLHPSDVYDSLNAGLRPEIDVTMVNSKLSALINQCWEFLPSNRYESWYS